MFQIKSLQVGQSAYPSRLWQAFNVKQLCSDSKRDIKPLLLLTLILS